MEKALSFVSEGRARQMAVALKFQTLSLTDEERHFVEQLRSAIRNKNADLPRKEGAGALRDSEAAC